MQILDSHVTSVRDCLFDRANIQRVLTYLVSRHAGQDALLTLACHMLTLELCLAWTDEGFAPFRHMPQHIIPYTVMTKHQLACVQDALQYACDMQLTQTCPKAGNGLYVYVASSAHVAVKAEPSNVLVAVVRILRKSRCLRSLATDVVCQRVIAKIHGSVYVPRCLFREALLVLKADEESTHSAHVLRGHEENKQSLLVQATGAHTDTHDVSASDGVAEQQAQGVRAV